MIIIITGCGLGMGITHSQVDVFVLWCEEEAQKGIVLGAECGTVAGADVCDDDAEEEEG